MRTLALVAGCVLLAAAGCSKAAAWEPLPLGTSADFRALYALFVQGRERLWAIGARVRPGPQSIYRRSLTK